MSAPPRVSVVMPAYNSATHIKEALLSARRQTQAPHEIIVVDDGSSDETAAIAAAHGARVIPQQNAGPAAARNAGIRAASGDWIAFLDADDLWSEQKLERQLRTLHFAPRTGILFSDFTTFDEGGTHQRTGFQELSGIRETTRTPLEPGLWLCDRESLGEHFLRSMFMLTSTVLARRDLLMGDDLFDVEMRCAEDYELFLRLIVRAEAAFVDEPLVAYRRGPDGITADMDLDVLSREQLLRHCAAHPERYPAGAATTLAGERTTRMNNAASLALRRGQFDAARSHALRSFRTQAAFPALMLLTIAGLCDNPLGRAGHALFRRVWRERPGKYRSC